MKKRNSVFLLLTASLLLILTSCGNLFYADLQKPEVPDTSLNTSKTGTICGSVSYTGAIPTSLAPRAAKKSLLSRTAFPTINTDTCTYKAWAATTDGSKTYEGSVTGSASTYNLSYSVPKLPLGQTYIVYVQALDGSSILLQGSEEIFMDSSIKNYIDVTLLPISTRGYGNISLFLSSESSKSITFDYSIDAGSYSTKTALTSSGSTITKNNLTAGGHTFQFRFWDGNILVYQCREAVNVFKGLTTDTWVKTTDEDASADMHLRRVAPGSNIAEFVLTDEAIGRFAQTTIYVNPDAETNGEGTIFSPYKNLDNALDEAISLGKQYIFIKEDTACSVTKTHTVTDKGLSISTYSNFDSNPGTAHIQASGQFCINLDNNGNGNLEISRINFIGDPGYTHSGNGSFININAGCTADFSQCTFNNGKSTGKGGAIYNAGEINLLYCLFITNYDNSGSSSKRNAICCEGTESDPAKINFLSETWFYPEDIITVGNHAQLNAYMWLLPDVPTGYEDVHTCATIQFLHEEGSYSGIFAQASEANSFNIKLGDYQTFNNNKLIIAPSTNAIYVDSNSTSEGTPDGTFKNPYRTIYEGLKAAAGTASPRIDMTVYIKDGTVDDGNWQEGTGGINPVNNISVKVYKSDPFTADTDPGTATIHINSLTTSMTIGGTFDATGLVFEGTSTDINYPITAWGTVTLTDCKFKNLKPASNSVSCIGLYGTLKLINCSFEDNKSSMICFCTYSDSSLNYTTPTVYLSGSTYFTDNARAFDFYNAGGSIVINEPLTTPSEYSSWKVKVSDEYPDGTVLLKGDAIASATGNFVFVNSSGSVIEKYIDWDGKLQSGIRTTYLYVDNTVSEGTTPAYNSQTNAYRTLSAALAEAENISGKIVIRLRTGKTFTDCSEITIPSEKDITLEGYRWSGDSAYETTVKLLHMEVSGKLTTQSVNFESVSSESSKLSNSMIEVTGTGQATFNSSGLENAIGTSSLYGAALSNSGIVTLDTCSIKNNEAGHGGAIYNEGTLTINDCEIEGNTASSTGGAIYSTGGLSITGDTTLTGNTCDDKPDFLYFKGSLALSGSITFTDGTAERIEFYWNTTGGTGNSNVTIGTSFSVSDKIPFYIDGNPAVSGNNFFAGTSDKSRVKDFFTVESPLEITDDGKIAIPTPAIALYINDSPEPTYPDNLNSAFDSIPENGSGTIRLLAGTTVEVGYSQLSQKTISIEVEGTGNATIKLNNQLDLGNNLYFNATGIIFDGEKINPETAINSGGLFFIGCNDSSSRANVSFKQCTFKNGKSQDNGGALYVQDNLTLEECTFENNTMNTDTPNDIVVWCGSLTLKGKNTFSSPICCNQLESNSPSITVSGIDLTSGSSYAEISCFDWTNLNYVESGYQIIEGLEDGQESWFPCEDEGYYIAPDGKILKSFSSIPDVSDIATGSTVILTPDSGVSADDITTFLNSEGDFKVNLDLSNLSAADIKNINPTLNHVDTLTLPGGNYVSNLYGQDESAGGGKALGLRKVIIKGDISAWWLFQNCTGIEEVVFEEGCTTIPAAMFAGCKNLKTVTLPSTLKTIEWQVFRGTAIEEITIPASVTTIQNNVFYVSDQTTPFKLTKVIFEDTEHRWSVRYEGTGAAYTDTYGNDYSSILVNDSSDIAAFFQLEAATQGDYWLVKNEQITPAAADVGDIILSDGSVIQYSEGLTLTEEQKANAIAVIFYKGTELNNDGNTIIVRTLGIGLQQPSKLMWCTTDASGYSLSPDSMVCELASSSTTETSIKTNTHRNGKNNFSNLSTYMNQNSITNDTSDTDKYPAFYFAIDYADSASNVSGTVFENDWYLPSMAELLELYNNKAIVNTSLEKCGGTQLSGAYRSSSPGWGANNTRAYSISMNDGLWSNMVKETTFNICAIIEFN